MPISEEERQRRLQWTGSSDCAALPGIAIDPWKSTIDLYLIKTGQMVPPEAGEEADWGNRLQDDMVDWLSAELGPIKEDQRYERPELRLACNVDGVVEKTGEPVEIKTTGLFGPSKRDEWGAADSDNIPLHHIVQCHGHLLSMGDDGPDTCHLAAFIGGRGPVRFTIKRNRDICTLISEASIRFWNDYVRLGVPPSGERNLEFVRYVVRQELAKAVDQGKVARWLRVRSLQDKLKAIRYGLENELLAEMDDAAVGDAGELGRLSFRTAFRNVLDSRKLRRLYPDIWRQCLRTTTHSTGLRWSQKRVVPRIEATNHKEQQ